MSVLTNLIGESVWVSQYNPNDTELGLVVHVAGEQANPDGDVTVTMETLSDDPNHTPEQVFSRVADNPEAGLFTLVPTSAETEAVGFYKVTWSYEVGGTEKFYVHALEVTPASRALDNLPEDFHSLLGAVWMRFSDLFDSPHGGPHLQVYYQTRFNRGRVAELMGTALRRLNVIAQPHMTYTLDGNGGKVFPVAQWGGILEQATFIEAIKHLIRSYAEQPDASSVSLARLDRRDYMSRWETVLRMEQEDYEDMIDNFKIAHMGLGRPRVLVSGGAYGHYGPTRLPFGMAARPHFAWRFFA